MARLQAKSLENPDEVRPTPFGHIDIYNLDDLVIGRMVFEPGWHWAEHVQPIAGTSLCQYHHVGICISGRLGNRMEDGTTSEIGPGQVYEIPPGHDGWVIGDERSSPTTSPASDPTRGSTRTPSACWGPSCSPISSIRPRSRSRLVRRAGGSLSGCTTSASSSSSTATAAGS